MAVLSPALRVFLEQRLASLEQIDVILLLRAEPERSWTAPEVAAQLSTPPESTAMRLFLLASSGMIAFEPSAVPRYRAVTADAETERLLHELAEIHRTDRDVLVQTLMKAGDATTADPLHSFADAFRLKK
ncbi:MAG TPA: hypothetical protein VF824_20505 [Thermoanaerobaculia bacterium]